MMLIITGTLSLNAQRGTRPPVSGIEKPQRPMMLEPSDSLKKRGMRKDMAENMGCMNSRQGIHHRKGMRHMAPGDRIGHGGGRPGMRNAPHGMMIDSIPGLTEEQKKEFADLKQKHQAEMQKFNEDMQKFRDEMQKLRQEMQAKMKEFRESHMSEMMNILNDEQKESLRGRRD